MTQILDKRMKQTFTCAIATVLCMVLCMGPISAGAEEETASTEENATQFLPPGVGIAPEIQANTPGAVDCFDYYKFGSVEVDVAPTLEQTLPGTPLSFSGFIKNTNAYPIVDGQVWVKIFKHDGSTDVLTKENGYQLVDFFLVESEVVLSSGSEETPSERPLTFDWQVPEALGAGTYTAAFFFTTAYRYNLLGLTFTDDVTGNKATFTISPLDTPTEPVVWNKNEILLNSTKFAFAAFPPHFTKDEPVTAYVELTNPSDEARIVEVLWVTSKWDGILPQNELKRETQGYSLAAHETKKLSYTPLVYGTGVTFLQAVVKDRDAKSILHIRYVRDGNEETRINYPGILSFPLKSGKETTIFSCLHSTESDVVTDNTLTLTLKDTEGQMIHMYTYAGDITGSMMGVKDTFTPTKDVNAFSLTASLFHKGVLVDEVTQSFDCAQVDPDSCTSGSQPIANSISDTTSVGATTLYTIVFAILILLVLGAFIISRRRNIVEATVPVTTPEPYDKNI
jgi:hypothetical protein